jgi:hypothetical protein
MEQQPCVNPGAPLRTFRVNFDAPPFETATTAQVLVGYRSNPVRIPGMGNDMSVVQRITMPQSGASVTPNDLN